MTTHARTLRHAAALLVLALVGAACSGSATTTISETAVADADAQPAEQQPEPTAEPEPTAIVEPEPTAEPTVAPEPTPTPAPIYFASELEVGDCFNRLPNNPPLTPPDKVSCGELHEEEVFAKALLDDPPDAPYPGTDALFARADAELCDAATTDFVGATFDLVPVSTYVLYPLEEEWDAGDRTIMCSATSNTEGVRKIGTAAGGSIDSGEVLVARSGLAVDGEDFDEWAVFSEHGSFATIGALTDAQFDLPLRRPFPVPQGFIFNAKAAGDDGHATVTWGYSWETGEFTDLGSILPTQELSSTVFADGATIFAARATPEDDWDIWSTASGDAQILFGGDGDQQYPTITPDRSKLVFQDNGDIWVADVDGSNPMQLTSGPENDWESIVSPDGSTVVFASDRSGNDDLWAVSIDGGRPVNLTNHPADENWPVFSEDGAFIYFGTDRLQPEDDRSILMVMNADGSNQSWFGTATGSQAIVVPSAIAQEVVDTTPSLNERYTYERLPGEPGTVVRWEHPSGRLSADLPAGWRVALVDEQIGFIAGPRPDRYFDVWEIDGVAVTLWDDLSDADFFQLYDDTTAVQTCDQFDGSDGVVPIEGTGLLALNGNFNCGDEGAVGGVIALYNTDAQIGVLIEGQRDNLPDIETDSAMLTAIAISLIWG